MNVFIHLRGLSNFHIFISKSDEHDARTDPEESKQILFIALVCALTNCSCFISSSDISQTAMEASSEDEINKLKTG